MQETSDETSEFITTEIGLIFIQLLTCNRLRRKQYYETHFTVSPQSRWYNLLNNIIPFTKARLQFYAPQPAAIL